MSIIISTRAEIIKTKRSAAFWLSIIAAALLPTAFMIMFFVSPEKNDEVTWGTVLVQGFQAFNTFLLPMFVVLICSLIPQIEYKNNAWKQVFASPQSLANIFFSKFITILFMIIFLFILFNVLLILSAVIPNVFQRELQFLRTSINWTQLINFNVKSFVSLLGIIAIQYWLSLRFKNFIVPIAIGVGALVISIILVQVHWKYVSMDPFAFPLLSMMNIGGGKHSANYFLNHELNSLIIFCSFTLLAFLDMKYRKERG